MGMSARVEAVAKALLSAESVHAPSFTWEVASDVLRRDYTANATTAIEAADAVMFGDAAVEDVARLLCSANSFYLDRWESYPDGSLIKDKFRTQARAVIAALKGDDDV